MARAAKNAENIQVFRGSLPKQDVFALNAGSGCCGPGAGLEPDRLGDRVHADNGLIHSNPSGFNDKFRIGFGGDNGFSAVNSQIVEHINTYGVGAQISVLVIPTFARVKSVAIKVEAQETGLTFNLITRNGLTLPNDVVDVVVITAGDGCSVTRTRTAGSDASFAGFGALTAGQLAKYILAYESLGTFALEADELILQVAAIPGTPVTGLFAIDVAVSYDVVRRCDEPR